MRISWLQGLHHEVSDFAESQWGSPDVIFGPNAGSVFPSPVPHRCGTIHLLI